MRRARTSSRAPSRAARKLPEIGRSAELLRLEGHVKAALELGRNRLLVAAALFLFGFLVIVGRLVDVMLLQDGVEPHAAAQPSREATEMERADIVDRNGVLLATNLATASVYADPHLISDAPAAAGRLRTVLADLDEDELARKLASDRGFVWIKRNLTPRQQYEVNRLGIPGVSFLREERRVYPHGRTAAHVLGMVGIDNGGLSGIERGLDDRLRRQDEPVALSLDIRIQDILHEELSRAVESFRAVGATGLFLDARSGEILAILSLPDFDPNDPETLNAETAFNRATLGVYEMGSSFKAFTVSMALDTGTVTLQSGYDASQPIRVGHFTISDYHAQNRYLTVPEIIMHSSNIGAAKMALDVGIARQRAYLERFGLLRAPKLELPEIGAPLLPAQWHEISAMTVAYGHGIAVTPIQIANAMAAVVNGGLLHPATLLRKAGAADADGVAVISPETSQKMRWLLRLVVEEGTGKKAATPGYLVGGKTGTAEKNVNGVYRPNSLLSSFVGAFPMNDPRYVVLVIVDEPKGNAESFGYATGGWVAAPVVNRVVSRVAPLLGIKPVAPDIDPGFDSLVMHVNAQGRGFATR